MYYIHYKLIKKIKRVYKYKLILKNIEICFISNFALILNKKIKTYPLIIILTNIIFHRAQSSTSTEDSKISHFLNQNSHVSYLFSIQIRNYIDIKNNLRISIIFHAYLSSHQWQICKININTADLK